MNDFLKPSLPPPIFVYKNYLFRSDEMGFFLCQIYLLIICIITYSTETYLVKKIYCSYTFYSIDI